MERPPVGRIEQEQGAPGFQATEDGPILKQFYFHLHLQGLLSHAALERLFHEHPEWKHA